MREDGVVIIKVTADTDPFNKELQQLTTKYEAKEIKLKSTEQKLEVESAKLEEIIRQNEKLSIQYEEQLRKREELVNALKEISNYEKDMIFNTPKDVSSMTPFAGQEENFKRLKKEFQSNFFAIDSTNRAYQPALEQQRKQQMIVDNLTASYKQQSVSMDILGDKIQNKVNTGLEETNTKLKSTNNKANNTLKSIAKWGLAIFGIQSAYAGIRSIMNGVFEQNEGLKKQMDSIKQSLSNAFTPIIEKIINLIKTLMAYVNYIWYRLFGKNLFKDVASSTEKSSKNLASGAKSAKEINKQLAEFDEANVLSNNKNTGGSGGGGSVGGSTSTSLGLDKVKIPKWLEKLMDWIKENPKMAKIIFGLAPFVLFGLGKLGGALTTVAIAKLIGKAGGKNGAGGTGLLGLKNVLTLVAIAWVCKLTWEGFDLLGYHVSGVKDLITEMKELDKTQKNRNETNKSVMETTNKVYKANIDVLKSEEANEEQRKKAIQGLSILNNSEYEYLQTKSGGTKIQLDHTKALAENAISLDKVYKSGKMTKDEEYEYYKMLNTSLNPALNKQTMWTLGLTDENKKLKDSFKQLDKTYKTQYEIEMKIKNKQKIDELVTALSKLSPSLSVGIGKVFEKTFRANGGISIVNMPGRGVPTEYVGDRGREGIIPMDNESQMQLLGQAIAKYVRIDNYISNYMDARKVNQILQASANQERLANNG